jgi:hypothetical protein
MERLQAKSKVRNALDKCNKIIATAEKRPSESTGSKEFKTKKLF